MFKPTTKVVKRKDTSKEVFAALNALTKRDVLVGIPESHAQRPPDEEGEESLLNNAELAYLHTEGSPAQRIPPRPFLQPAIIDGSKEIGALQIKVIKAALAGKADLAIRNQEKLGLHAQILVQNWFTDPKNNWPPNAPLTIRLKGSSSPMIDSGELRKSITYVLRVDGEDLPNF